MEMSSFKIYKKNCATFRGLTGSTRWEKKVNKLWKIRFDSIGYKNIIYLNVFFCDLCLNPCVQSLRILW